MRSADGPNWNGNAMPVVIALMGLPGSGKTTFAERLVRARDLSLVSRDAIRAAMFRPCRFTEQEKQAAYRAAGCLELGRSCVVEGMPFSRASVVDELRKLAQRAGAGFMPVFLDCPVEDAQARARRDIAEQGQHAGGSRRAPGRPRRGAFRGPTVRRAAP